MWARTSAGAARAQFADAPPPPLRPPFRYAKRSGAELHVVDSLGHPSFADWNRTVARRANSGTPVNSHFLKLPMLQWFLQRFDRVLFLGEP